MKAYLEIEMPTSCYDCDFAYQDQDSEHNVYWTCTAVHKSACMHERREDCPLVPIPPHGKLIDADAFTKDECNNCDGACEALPCDCLNCKADCRCDFMQDIANAPTVIPPEEGEI